jgi:hypothetical protein
VRFYTTVFLAPIEPALVVGALTAALAPFDMNDYRREPYDPNATWDSWRLPEQSFLQLKPDHRDPRVTRIASSQGDPILVAAPKGTIDLEAIRGAARERALGAWNAWAEVARRHPEALPRGHFDAIHADRADAQQAYLLQPAVQEVAQAATTQQHPYFTFSLLLADPVATFSGAREVYLARAMAECLTTHAYVTLDGQWLCEYTDDRGSDAHMVAFTDYLDSLPDDTLIAHVVCHS